MQARLCSCAAQGRLCEQRCEPYSDTWDGLQVPWVGLAGAARDCGDSLSGFGNMQSSWFVADAGLTLPGGPNAHGWIPGTGVLCEKWTCLIRKTRFVCLSLAHVVESHHELVVTSARIAKSMPARDVAGVDGLKEGNALAHLNRRRYGST